MVYNRCIGTRYCSNNCPYKVRRFNFLEYDANQFEQPVTRKLMRNPERQRAQPRRDGEMHLLHPAHQRGEDRRHKANRADPRRRDHARVRAGVSGGGDHLRRPQRRQQPRRKAARLASNYGLLAELNTRPRTTYLAKLRNPNPEVIRMIPRVRAHSGERGRPARTSRRLASKSTVRHVGRCVYPGSGFGEAPKPAGEAPALPRPEIAYSLFRTMSAH